MINAITSTADANATAATNTVAKPVGLADTFDTFLKLLTTQLQYQDPLSPLDTNQFTQQLVQFSQVEQTIKGNKTLDQLLSTTRSAQFANAASYLGHVVSANTASQTVRADVPATWDYTLGATAADTTLSVYSDRGVKVFEAPGEVQAGGHSFVWNGKGSDNRAVPPGTYRLEVAATSSAGSTIAAQVTISGRVDSVEVANGINRLVVAGTPVNLDAVTRVIAQ